MATDFIQGNLKGKPSQKYGFTLQNVSSDNNNCFFYSILFELKRLNKLYILKSQNPENHHQETVDYPQKLRELVAEYYEKQDPNLKFHFTGMPTRCANGQTKVNISMTPSQWASHIKIPGNMADTIRTPEALAKILDVEIHIFSYNDANKKKPIYKVKKFGNSKDKIFLFYSKQHCQILQGIEQSTIDKIKEEQSSDNDITEILKNDPDAYADLLQKAEEEYYSITGEVCSHQAFAG
jgi:hypothetical protein